MKKVRDMADIKEAIRLYYKSKFSVRNISNSIGIPRSTLSDYIRKIEDASIPIDELLSYSESELKKRLFGERKQSAGKIMPDIDYLSKEIRRPGVTKLLLWQEYKENNPFGYEYTQFKVHMQEEMNKLNPSFRNIYRAGEKGFVDFSGLTIRYFGSGIQYAEVFVSVLGASDCLFAKATESQTMEEFNLAHRSAFEYYGGVPQVITPDNLKSGVIKNTKKELNLNKNYKDLARHYGFIIDPARPNKPKDKPKVENGVKITQRWIIAKLRNRRFFSVDEINEAIIPLLNQYNERKLRYLNKSRFDLLREIELPNMLSLPDKAYVYRTCEKRLVPKDYHVGIEDSFYSVPYKLINETVSVWHSKTSVEIYSGGELLAVHPKIRGTSTLTEHMPENHKAMLDRYNPSQYLSWAVSIGFNTGKFVKKILEKKLHYSITNRYISQLKHVCKKYDPSLIEETSRKALSMNTCEVKHFIAIIEKEEEKPVISKHENIRGKNNYR